MRASFLRGWRAVGAYWVAAWAIVILYVAAYGSMIQRDGAVPYWDQSGYVGKTYRLVEAWNEAGAVRAGRPWWWRALAHFEPGIYLAAEPALRPPLMEMVPALLWRHHATAHEMAWAWLVMRVLMLMGGAWVLAREVKDARWVPLAVAVILGSQGFLKLNQNVYLMDVPFAAGALLAVALVVRAMRRRTMQAAALAGVGTVALLLIKPQALAFMFPFYVFLVGERVVYVWRSRRVVPWRGQVLATVRWGLAMVGLLEVIVYLLQSPYGVAAAAQYKLNTEGFWQHSIDGKYLWVILTGVVPPWLALAAVTAAIFGRKAWFVRPALLGCVAVGAGWWVAFNLFLSFGIDPRLVWSISPVVVYAVCMVAWRVERVGKVVTVVAGIWFVLALGMTVGWLPGGTLPTPGFVMGPPIVRQQVPADVGMVPFVAASARELAGMRDARIEVMACDDFVEADALNLAARWENRDHWSAIHYEAAPWADDGFDVADLFVGARSGWYGTKMMHPTTTSLSKAAFVNLLAMHSLITREDSPIHGLFEARVRQPLVQAVPAETGLYGSEGPSSATMQDELVLWHLRRPLTAKECREAVVYVLPQYAGTSGLEQMKGQLAVFDRAVAHGGSGVEVVPADALPPVSEAVVHDVMFGDKIVLRALTLRKESGGGMRVTMFWQASGDVDLDKTRFMHLDDAAGNIVRQADSPQDPMRGHVAGGTIWRDEVLLSAEQLQGVKSVGIGLVGEDGKISSITPMAGVRLDWNDRRLIVGLGR